MIIFIDTELGRGPQYTQCYYYSGLYARPSFILRTQSIFVALGCFVIYYGYEHRFALNCLACSTYEIGPERLAGKRGPPQVTH